jgi:aspartate racemase
MDDARLGVLGGMGPQATEAFYQIVIDRTDASCDQEHVPTLILSDSKIPDRTQAILSGDTDPVYQHLLGDARMLQDCGCTVLAIPCNTSHYFVDRLQSELDVPIVHMIRETARVMAERGCRKVGILATDGTIRGGLYQKELAAVGVDTAVPGDEAQHAVMSIIYDEIKRGEDGSRDKFATVDRDLRGQGCDGCILACTELSVYRMRHEVPRIYVDAMEVLAERSVTACGYPLREV